MNAYSFVIAVILIRKAFALEEREEYYDVGTVLFSPTDVIKSHWTNAEIRLLQARRDFLQIIPPPHIINPQNENFADAILEYFKEIYSTIKRETTDIESGNLLMTALSDTIGGHMKMWILPIIKSSYYGGKVRKESALKLYQFYDDIQKYLDTKGNGWREPNLNLLRCMSIDIAPRKEYSRSIKDPCQALAYFEKSDSGLIIPIPKVSWERGSEAMFVPLRNQSIVSLNSPNSTDILFKYYDIAKKCIETSNIDNESKYDNRIQNWLLVDIIPHLNDEKLYPALRSVLSLVNTTLARNLGDTVVGICPATPKPCEVKPDKKCFMPFDLSSKKMVIVSIIILIEIAWCISTLCYLVSVKWKKKMKYDTSNVYFYIEPTRSNKRCWTDSTTQKSLEFQILPKCAKVSTKSMGIGRSPITTSCNAAITCTDNELLQENSIHSVGICTHSNVKSQVNRSFDPNNMVHQSTSHGRNYNKNVALMTVPDKRAKSKFKISSVSNYSLVSPYKELESKSASYVTVQDCPKSKKSKKSLQEKDSILKTEIISYVDETSKVAKQCSKNGSKRPKKQVPIPVVNKKTSKVDVNSSKQSYDVRIEKVIKTILKPSNNKRLQAPRNSLENKKVDINCDKKLVIQNTDKPYIEIIIDRPPGEISVDIVDNTKAEKPSKIPKRFFNNCNTQTFVENKERQVYKMAVGRSLIPQPKKQNTVDDITVPAKTTCKDNVKLNVTL